jgi:N-acyl-D-amino-acid deacylase
MLDLVIKDGLIADGTGHPRFRGDVGISDDRIVAVGTVTGAAQRTLQAEGLLVTPGFVDIHTHFDGQVSWDSLLAPSSVNGVTSVAMGNCGVGFAPAHRTRHDWLIALLEGVEDIPGTALAEGLTWNWESFPDYLDALGRRQFALDVGAQVPHAALRAYVMGDRGGSHTEQPTDTEIDQMERLTFEALQAGALGFSTSRTQFHVSRDGHNIGTLGATDRELVGIAKALRRAGRGVVQLISDAYLTPDDAFAEAELGLIRKLAQTSGGRLSFTVLQADSAPDRWRSLLTSVQGMVDAGLPIKAQVAPRPVGVIFSFASSTSPFSMVPAYQQLLSLPLEARLAKLSEPEVKSRILEQHRQLPTTGMIAGIARAFSRMFRMSDPVDYEPQTRNSLQAEADRVGRSAVDYAYDTFLENGGRRQIYLPLINYSHGDLGSVYEMMIDPNALYGLSDAGAHCGTICDGSFPTTTLALWSRGNRAGQSIPVEKLVHGYTQRNAEHIGWTDRGVIAPGYLADLNVIDLDGLNLSPPEIVSDLPAGGARLLQTAHGYRWTIKNGRVTFENGASTGELPGRLQRSGQATAKVAR